MTQDDLLSKLEAENLNYLADGIRVAFTLWAQGGLDESQRLERLRGLLADESLRRDKSKVFTFDVQAWMVARVTATSEAEARKALYHELRGLAVPAGCTIELGEAIPEVESSHELIEIDGEAV